MKIWSAAATPPLWLSSQLRARDEQFLAPNGFFGSQGAAVGGAFQMAFKTRLYLLMCKLFHLKVAVINKAVPEARHARTVQVLDGTLHH
jgi:hypothetical protein